MSNQTNAIQTDINTLNAISETLQNTHDYIAQNYEVDSNFLNRIESAKLNIDNAVRTLEDYSDAIADVYQAPPPPTETF